VTNLITRKANPAQPHSNGSNGAPFKLQADPRITRVGRILRKTSMDEIPQLFNVLKGDMSMVGPRPPIPYEAQKYESWHLRRVLDMRPGITGLWQVSGRSRVTFDEMVRMDLRYMRNNSLMGDIGIMIRTVKVVFLCEGGG
jgi:lipopolysaccharide/colanic/teichoic acid biosynthesis glycosyltransferase